jgi:hypothetical protein
MAISDDLFLAILSMDAYNRGYAAGLGSGPLGLGDVGSSIGNATVITQSPSNPNSLEVQKSFFAQAYTWNGQTVISYRGTDTPSPFSSGNDFWTGWTLGAGFPSASQGTMARQFYETVTGQSVFAAAPSDVILTGHSLGGGLAGFIAALSGAETVGFDHMPFGQAAIAAFLSEVNRLAPGQTVTPELIASLGLRIPTASTFDGYYLEGEINGYLRDGSIAIALGTVLSGIPYVGTALAALGGYIAGGQIAYEATVDKTQLSAQCRRS